MRASNQVEISTEFLANKTIKWQGAVDRKESLLQSMSGIFERQILKAEQEAFMGTIDVESKKYLSDGEIFADVFNYLRNS